MDKAKMGENGRYIRRGLGNPRVFMKAVKYIANATLNYPKGEQTQTLACACRSDKGLHSWVQKIVDKPETSSVVLMIIKCKEELPHVERTSTNPNAV